MNLLDGTALTETQMTIATGTIVIALCIGVGAVFVAIWRQIGKLGCPECCSKNVESRDSVNCCNDCGKVWQAANAR